MGPSAGAPSWQSGSAAPANQHGNTTGAGQEYATIADHIYFIVLKYTFNHASDGNGDTVSFWVNPFPSTLGYDDGEALAGTASYYSAINALVKPTPQLDAVQIQSFMLIGLAQSAVVVNKSIDISLDELRIGTTWADVTPAPPQIISIAGAGTTNVTVTWNHAQIGTNYVLQYNTNLSAANWSNLAPVTAAGTTASQIDNPPDGDAARFYRVLKP